MVKKLERARLALLRADGQHTTAEGHKLIRSAITILDDAIAELSAKKGKATAVSEHAEAVGEE